MSDTHTQRTRLAPSPTGALHLGNARTFLVNWAIARRERWSIVLRVEDLDGPRVKPEAIEGVCRTLAWLGIDWDTGPLVQSQDLGPCREAMGQLARAGRAYPSAVSRAEVESAASAPHPGDHEVWFGPQLRPAGWGAGRSFEDTGTAWRFVVPEGPEARVGFVDRFAGAQGVDVGGTVGDFVIWTRRGVPAYQLAVVVDDHRQGVTRVIRGDDLISSAGRQLLLWRALGLGPEPEYWHLPLVVGPDGRRLAKRHGDTRVDRYRGLGVPAEAVVGLCAWWCGMTPERRLMSAREFAAGLDVSMMPRAATVMGMEDEAWLHGCASRR
ncbi:MAG: tRNA glutamyl-Q(34) synthetase GluQRS [Planctomyces sp.]|nr:tRNA glutamyl-Q(34) synthetase GluQRS [Planctomyces sp.]MBA4119164.1 tRNA glutamyl-Q(34) synthetase GluQRS [Isosphaera sp.]